MEGGGGGGGGGIELDPIECLGPRLPGGRWTQQPRSEKDPTGGDERRTIGSSSSLIPDQERITTLRIALSDVHR